MAGNIVDMMSNNTRNGWLHHKEVEQVERRRGPRYGYAQQHLTAPSDGLQQKDSQGHIERPQDVGKERVEMLQHGVEMCVPT